LSRAAIHVRGDCAENLRKVGTAVAVYSLDNRDRLPGCQHAPPSWIESLAPYCSPNAFTCPAQASAQTAIALNDFFTPHPHGARKLNYTLLSSIPAPAATLLFAEGQASYLALKYDHYHFADAIENGFCRPRFRQQVDLERHGLGANYLFPDGHVQKIRSETALKSLDAPHSFFVHPEGISAAEYISDRINPWY
jgi:prepilin-type processing-associated H-X9-DG protein